MFLIRREILINNQTSRNWIVAEGTYTVGGGLWHYRNNRWAQFATSRRNRRRSFIQLLIYEQTTRSYSSLLYTSYTFDVLYEEKLCTVIHIRQETRITCDRHLLVYIKIFFLKLEYYNCITNITSLFSILSLFSIFI